MIDCCRNKQALAKNRSRFRNRAILVWLRNGMRKKRRVDPERERYWREILKKFQASQLPFKKFCAIENISPNTFQFWRAELRRRDEEKGLESEISIGENRPSQLKSRTKYWTQIFSDLEQYRGSIRDFCKEHGITSGSLHYWQTKLGRRPAQTGQAVQPPAFIPVEISGNSPPSSEPVKSLDETILVTLIDGTCISCSNTASVDLIVRLINGLRNSKPVEHK